MTKLNEKFSNRVLNTPECKVVVREVEFTFEEITEMPMHSAKITERLFEEGFNMKGLITLDEDFEKRSVVYKQRKYIIPKVKKV